MFILSILVVPVQGNAQPGERATDAMFENTPLHGPVTTVTFTQGYLVPEDGGWVEREMAKLYHDTYNQKRELARSEKFDRNGVTQQVVENNYNNGKIIQEKITGRNGRQFNQMQWAYNPDGTLAEKISISPAGDTLLKVMHEYDDQGNLLQINRLSGLHGAIKEVTLLDYEYNRLVLMTKFAGDGALDYIVYYSTIGDPDKAPKTRPVQQALRTNNTGDTVSVFQYNSDSALIIERVYYPRFGTWHETRYAYDQYGNVNGSVTTEYESYGECVAQREGVEQTRLEIAYEYDTFGNWTKMVFTNTSTPDAKAVRYRAITYH